MRKKRHHFEQQGVLTKPGSLLGVEGVAAERVVGVAPGQLVDGEGEDGEGHGQPGRDGRAQADCREHHLQGREGGG